MFLFAKYLFDQEAVRVSSCFGSKNGQDEAEEEGEQSKSDHGQDLPLANVGLALSGLCEHDHPADDEAVHHHHEVGLQHKLALEEK